MSSQLVTPSTAVTISKSLMLTFSGVVTLWYLVTPYLVQPHPQFNLDYEKYVAEKAQATKEANLIENWTKWRLFLGDDDRNFTIFSLQRSHVDIQEKNLMAAFEWREEYKSIISRDDTGLTVEREDPWYSKHGLYNHYYVQKTENGGIRFLPRFMFGVPHHVLEEMYGGADNIPITGMLTESSAADRIVLQCIMNVVTLAVVFLLYINNPPNRAEKKQD